MDFDNAWCPACDRQIQPKRFTVSVPIQPKQGLVNGTGRLKHIKQQPHLKKRTVIDQGPIPLYCSDECQLADLSATRSGPPIDPACDEPTAPTKYPTQSDSIAKIAKLYNFPPLPPPLPAFDDPQPSIPASPPQYTSGIMMAGRLISSLCPPPAKPHVGPHRPPLEPRKPVPGWTDGSNAWRASVYSFSQPTQSPLHPDGSNKAYGSFTASPHRTSRVSSSFYAPPPPSQRSSSDEMIAKFSQSLQRRSESRASLYPSAPTPTSPTLTQSISHSPPRRERALLPPAVQGKLLVPDVKLKVHSCSSTSLPSTWSGPTSASSSARSPLSLTSDSEEEDPSVQSASLPGYRKRPTVESESLLIHLGL